MLTTNPLQRRLQMLRRLAWVSVALLLLVTSLSAYLRLSKAGLGCADWPQCYGQSLRDLQQGIAVRADEQSVTAAARLAHRFAATGALLLVVTMVLLCVGSRPVLRKEGALAVVLLGLALCLAVLGRWSSDARLPAVTMANVLGGFAMVALCVRLGVAGMPLRPPRLRLWVGVALLVTTLQIALGSLVSSSYSALSCSNWADCLATARGLDWGTLNPWREPLLGAAPSVNPQGALANLLHRGLGLSLVALVLPLSIVVLRRGRPRAAAALFVLLLVQAAIGVAMLQGPLPLSFALLHNLLAAMLLATLLLVY